METKFYRQLCFFYQKAICFWRFCLHITDRRVRRWVSKGIEDNHRPPILWGREGGGGHSRNDCEAVSVVARLQGVER
jgi:hypothetical protein